MRTIISFIVLLFVSFGAGAQPQKDTALHEVRVEGKKDPSGDARLNIFSPGQKVTTIDSTTLERYQMQSMAALLSQQVPVFVKSYGFNGLATLSFRGASAAQSAVLWNGVPIQNAALGVADVSALPVLMMGKVNIVYGGSGALWGSGNVGGALLVENAAPVFDPGRKKLFLSGGMGSFGQYMAGVNSKVSGKRWYFALDAFGQSAQNNFTYTDDLGNKVKTTNSQLQSGSVMGTLAYKIKEQSTVSLSVWYQQYYRGIPPALFEASSVKKQADGSLRTLLAWDKKKGLTTWYAKASLIRDEVDYEDAAISLVSDNTVYQFYGEAGWKRVFPGWGQALVFVPLEVSWLPQADGAKQRDEAALAVAYDLKRLNRLDIAVNARAEAIDEVTKDSTIHHNIVLPGMDVSYALSNWFALRANVQRTYRVPTLNELYYFPGGNTSLRPEQGWSEDAGYTFRKRMNSIEVHHDLSVFTRDIHDWIYWVGGAIWTPHNIAEVHSRGVETESTVYLHKGRCTFTIGLNTAYVLSTTVASYIPNDGSAGKQIPYAPRYNGQLNLGVSYKNVSFNYNHTYTGYRFTTTDESAWLTPYQTGNVQAACDLKVRKHLVELTAQCNNIWNEKYQVVDQRPMPGTNWLAGFKLRIL